jgi:hypothetical protein
LNEIAVALITAAATIIGNLIISRKSAQDMTHKLEMHQAVTDTKLEELTREVRAHNNFAQRMPVVENEIKTLNSTVTALQKYHME